MARERKQAEYNAFIRDPVLPHSEAWYESLELLAHAGRVLVL